MGLTTSFLLVVESLCIVDIPVCKSQQPMIYGLSKRELPIGQLGLTTSFLLVVESLCFGDVPVCKSEQPMIYGLSKRELPIGHLCRNENEKFPSTLLPLLPGKVATQFSPTSIT